MDERMKSPEDELVEHDVLKHVMSMLETMDAREATVLRMRFGLDDMEPHTLKEIGEQLGIPAATVRSRLHLAIVHMRTQAWKLD